ncbi:hypothetical protein LTS18_013698, partial [Coniosporium uncinatum]
VLAKTRFWRVHEIDLDSGRRKDLDAKAGLFEDGGVGAGGTEKKKRGVWQKMKGSF